MDDQVDDQRSLCGGVVHWLASASNWNVNSAQLVANTEKKSEFFFCLTTFSSQGWGAALGQWGIGSTGGSPTDSDPMESE